MYVDTIYSVIQWQKWKKWIYLHKAINDNIGIKIKIISSPLDSNSNHK